jgi:hypothetical protein
MKTGKKRDKGKARTKEVDTCKTKKKKSKQVQLTWLASLPSHEAVLCRDIAQLRSQRPTCPLPTHQKHSMGKVAWSFHISCQGGIELPHFVQRWQGASTFHAKVAWSFHISCNTGMELPHFVQKWHGASTFRAQGCKNEA